jgi:IS4 transposase
MLYIEKLGKVYYCPLKDNRQTNESGEPGDYHRVDSLNWTPEEQQHGKRVHLKGFPKGHQLKLFRLLLSPKRTDYVVTNDLAQDSVEAVQEACSIRWKIEEFHRETKQVTGIEACQCRTERIQRNHIGCAILVWVRLKHLAYQTGQTLYKIKHNLLDEYMVQQLKNPTVQMTLA